MKFRGQVQQVRLEPITEQGVVTYTTVIATQNPDQKLRPGMTANVSVMVARRENALKVPNAALRFRPPAPAGTKRAAVAGGTGSVSRDAGVRRDTSARPEGSADHAGARRWAGAGRGVRPGREAPADSAAADGSSLVKPGTVYVLRGGKPEAIALMSGITDGAMTEILAADLKPDDPVIIGYDVAVQGQNQNLRPPPGMGGPFRGPGARGAGGRR
jgi:HlyD family secretion protein